MESRLVKVGKKAVLNLDAVAAVHWEAETLFVHLLGGRWEQYAGDDAVLLWEVIDGLADELPKSERPRVSGK